MRKAHNSKLKTQNCLRQQLKTQNSKFKTPNMGKLIIFSAPSGSGKSTIINRLMQHPELHLAFSISCTSRAPRGTEKNGVEYFFLSPEEFKQRIANDEFLEYEEVIPTASTAHLSSKWRHRLRVARTWCSTSTSRADATSSSSMATAPLASSYNHLLSKSCASALLAVPPTRLKL